MKSSRIKAQRISENKKGIRVALAGRASYFYCLQPQPDDIDVPDGPKSYKSAILFPKDSPKAAINVVLKAIKDCVVLGMETKWGGKKPANLQLPLNNGDEKAEEDEEKYGAYKGNYHMSAKKQERQGRPKLKANKKVVETEGIIESGDWCLFDVTFYPFANKKKGVAVALNAVTLIEEGERFAGGPSEDSIDEAADDLYGDVIGGEEADDLLDDMLDDEDDFAGLL